ncbi:MAG: glycogen synthase [Planctomycetes bacterium]|nr:glycogen synthase [Planctomycetota bacterium]
MTKVLFAASEATPFARTGEMGDVVGALVKYLSRLGHDVTLAMPLYQAVRQGAPHLAATNVAVSVDFMDLRVQGLWREGRLPGGDVPVWFLENDHFFGREHLYGPPTGDYDDNAKRFVFFCRGLLELLAARGERFDVIHCHDWQTALLPVYLKHRHTTGPFEKVRSVLTVHNLAYQGIFWHWDMALTGLDWKHFNWQELEFFGSLGFLKGGLVNADRITTLSPTYARDAQTKDHGCGLHEMMTFRARDLRGIPCGIDPETWDSAHDPALPAAFSANDQAGKQACRAAALEDAGLPATAAADRPLIAVTGPLVEQRGMPLLLAALEELLARGALVAVLGLGEERYHVALQNLVKGREAALCVRTLRDDRLTHRLLAGADMALLPARSDSSGLGALTAARYGAIPIARAVGGLAEAVTDHTAAGPRSGDGFLFTDETPAALLAAFDRALAAWRDRPLWQALVSRAMSREHSWALAAAEYARLYENLVAPPTSPGR